MALDAKNYDPALMAGAQISNQDAAYADSSGNAYLKFSKATTAVNQVTVANAATGNNPSLSATGTDSNISLQLSAAGTGLVLLGGAGTATVAGGSATVNAQKGTITTASLSTAAGTATTFTINNTLIGASSRVYCSVYNGTNTGGLPTIGRVTPFAGSATVEITNITGGGSLNGTLIVPFLVTS